MKELTMAKKRTTALIVPAKDTTGLAGYINAEHGAAQEAAAVATAHAHSAIHHARNAGKKLIEARGILGHGSFIPWVRENLSFSLPTAYRYITIADNWQELLPNFSRERNLTIRGALQLLQNPPEEEEEVTPPEEENDPAPSRAAERNGTLGNHQDDTPEEQQEQDQDDEGDEELLEQLQIQELPCEYRSRTLWQPAGTGGGK
jgi:hypothetical protein